LKQAQALSTMAPGYDRSMAGARLSLSLGDYDAAITQAQAALNAKPGDSAAMDLVLSASLRKTALAPPGVPQQVQKPPTPPVAPPGAPPVAPPVEPPPHPPTATPEKVKILKNEVAASADLFYGQGTVSVPFGYALALVEPVTPAPS